MPKKIIVKKVMIGSYTPNLENGFYPDDLGISTIEEVVIADYAALLKGDVDFSSLVSEVTDISYELVVENGE